MILEFGAQNFYSFKEGFVVSLRLGDSCPELISSGKKHTNILAIKGANACGKTNVFKAISFLQGFTLASFDTKPESEIPFHTYFNNEETTKLYIIFSYKNKEYKYEIELNRKAVISEVFYQNTKILFKRHNNEILKIDKLYVDLKGMKLRSNASLISTAIYNEFKSINLIKNVFRDFVVNVGYSGLLNEQFINYRLASELYHNNEILLNFAVQVLKTSDTGITNIIIKDKKDDETGDVKYYPLFEYKIDGKSEFLPYSQQSSGVKSLFRQLGAYKLTLDNGGALFLDEFDINLHPDLLPALVAFFENTERNPKNAQLIFSTHNVEIMDMLKKYRTVFVNKEENESFLYRLDEITGEMLRNDRSLLPLYHANKLGGKPRIV